MIGEKLKEIREKKGLNKKEFAACLGLKYTTYNNYETEARDPAPDFLVLVSRKFNVSIDYLFGLEEESTVLHSYPLKSEEYEYVKKYRTLDETGRQHVDAVLGWETGRMHDMAKRIKAYQAALAQIPDNKKEKQEENHVLEHISSIVGISNLN